jgi:hypothetical protein
MARRRRIRREKRKREEGRVMLECVDAFFISGRKERREK